MQVQRVNIQPRSVNVNGILYTNFQDLNEI